MTEPLHWLEAPTTLTATPDSRAMQRIDWLEPRQSAPVLDDGMGDLDGILGRIGGGGIDLGPIGGGGGASGSAGGSIGTIDNPRGRLDGFWGLKSGTTDGWNMGVPQFVGRTAGQVAGSLGKPGGQPAAPKITPAQLQLINDYISKIEERGAEALKLDAETQMAFDDAYAAEKAYRRNPTATNRDAVRKAWEDVRTNAAAAERAWRGSESNAKSLDDFEKQLKKKGVKFAGAFDGRGVDYETQRKGEAAEAWLEVLSGPKIGSPLIDPPATVDARGSTTVDEPASRELPLYLGRPGSEVAYTTEEGSKRASSALNQKLLAYFTLPKTR
jgi:hypothetical protein